MTPTDKNWHCSNKKMLKPDTTWATHKKILDCIIDTPMMTIELPPHCIERLFSLPDTVTPCYNHANVNNWQILLGELRSMVMSIPGGRGLFCILQEALVHRCDNNNRLHLIHIVHVILHDFWWLSVDLAKRPTQIADIIPMRQPAPLEAHDTT
jgi:hypothetical protein